MTRGLETRLGARDTEVIRCMVFGAATALMLSPLSAAYGASVYEDQWGYQKIQAPKAWSVSHDCSQIKIAVLDSGVDATHPDLKDNVVGGRNFTTLQPTDNAADDNLHGTHVAGTISASGDERSGAAGICQKATVLAVKIADAKGRLADSDIIEGVGYAVDQGAKVINASFGGSGKSKLMEAAIRNAKNTLFVAAAGNGDEFGNGINVDREPMYPASYDLPNIVAVAATDSSDSLGEFSNYGKKSVHLAAPGVSVMSTTPVEPTDAMARYKIPTSYARLNGTSMATPHVAGAAALIWSQRPSFKVADVKRKLLTSVDRIPELEDKVSTGGRLNLSKLLQ